MEPPAHLFAYWIERVQLRTANGANEHPKERIEIQNVFHLLRFQHIPSFVALADHMQTNESVKLAPQPRPLQQKTVFKEVLL
jgi:hypothetical protein